MTTATIGSAKRRIFLLSSTEFDRVETSKRLAFQALRGSNSIVKDKKLENLWDKSMSSVEMYSVVYRPNISTKRRNQREREGTNVRKSVLI